MTTPRSNPQRWSLAAALVVLLVGSLSGPAGAAGPDREPAAGGATAAPTGVPAGTTPAGTQQSVMLLTGDVVRHSSHPDGTTTVTVDPAPRPDGRNVHFQTVQSSAGHYVIPSDASELLSGGVVDPELFNVTTLVEDSSADTDTLPVIVTGGAATHAAGGAATHAAGGAMASDATSPVTDLPSINGAGTELDPDRAGALWQQLRDTRPPAGVRATGTPTRVWLDKTVEVSLDESVPQIGVPDVWDLGYDGTGVTVAVLDTGIDPDHPDLVGKVVDTANFTPDPLADGHGHGTHVASIMAGSGAASDGAYRGVAPGADLMIGKVLPDSGTGPTSAVIDGMEWAAHNGADVASLSLGSPATDGTDPASVALNNLTDQTGTLFVVASGNDEGDASVNSPAAADSALAVGNVDKEDELVFGSNRGPRLGDAGVKPELTAPGTGIAAARADGTSMGTPVDAHYTRAGGTSMATPHVAGAAALLAQAYPDWSWQELKDALVSTAEPGDYSTFEGGAGRLDAARAATAGVYGPASVNAGAFPAPYDQQRTEELTYRNHTGDPVTLDLALSGRSWHGEDLPDGAATLSADTLTVPAGGTATVTLTVDAASGDVGAYTGVVTASSDTLDLRTPFGYYKSTGSNALTITLRDFRGDPQDGSALRAVKLDGGLPNDPFNQTETWEWSDENGQVTLHVADGLYDVYGAATSYWDTHGDGIMNMVEPEIRIEDDTSVLLEPTNMVKVDPQLPGSTDLKSAGVSYFRTFPDGGAFGTGFMVSYSPISFYVQPAEHSVGSLEVKQLWNRSSPLVNTAEVRGGGDTVPITPEYHNYYAGPGIAGSHDLELVDAGAGTPDELAEADVAGKVALIGIPVPHDDPFPYTAVWNAAGDATDAAADLGAAGVLVYIDEPDAKAVFNLRSEEILQFSIPWQEAVAVRDLIDGGSAPAQLVVEAQRDPSGLYHMRFLQDASQPRAEQVDPDADMVAVESRYHSDEPGYLQTMLAMAFLPDESTVSGLSYRAWAPLAVTEHFLAGDHLRWTRSADQRGSSGRRANAGLISREMFLPGDEPDTDVWFQSPMRTGAADVSPETWAELMCSFCRHGDTFRPGVWYLDSDPGHYERSILQEGTSFRMFVGDEEIPNSGSSFVPAFPMRSEPATYRLEMEGVQPGVPQARTLAPRIDTTWTFHSRRPSEDAKPDGYSCPFNGDTGCAFQPLLQLDYQLDLDMLNRADAGGRHTFDLRIMPHSGTPPHLVKMVPRPWVDVEYSTDGGQTWQEAAVRPGPGRGRFQVTVDHPPLAQTDGYVWLRTQARDTAGNRVEQTIERAYGLR